MTKRQSGDSKGSYVFSLGRELPSLSLLSEIAHWNESEERKDDWSIGLVKGVVFRIGS